MKKKALGQFLELVGITYYRIHNKVINEMPNANEKKRFDNPPRLALAGPFGLCAIGVIQLAGKGSIELFNRFFSKPLPEEFGKITLGTFRDDTGRTVDQILAVKLGGPIVEITCHGGIRITQRIIDTLKRAGATLVEPETLIPESFGITDPLASEIYRLLPAAKTTLAVKYLLAQLDGDLGKLLKTGGDEASRKSALAYWPAIRFLLEGVRIAIAGPPNVGKSTLLNELTQSKQALVADLPGTTRDYVQVETEFTGLPATLIDTAGLGRTADPLADEVRRRSLTQIAAADLVLVLLDATDPNSNQQFINELPKNISRAIVLINKIDRVEGKTLSSKPALPEAWPEIKISAMTGQNLEQLSSMIWKQLGLEGFDYRRLSVFSQSIADRLAGFSNP
jgi:tRNA modification GTPase